MMRHDYSLDLIWTGHGEAGTTGVRDYDRSYQIEVAGKPVLEGSADRPFRGDASRHNPEDLLMAALASCHMLAYLYLAAREGLQVLGYRDRVHGQLLLEGEAGRFAAVQLRPMVSLAPGQDPERANALHEEAHRLCFIANSINFPVHIAAVSTIDSP
ncbi:OsmC family protein [Frateuria aurantia]